MNSLPLSLPLVLTVVLGPAVAFGRGDLPVHGLVLWPLSALAAVAVAARFRRIDSDTLWTWLLLALFVVGYFAKSFFAAVWLTREGSLEALNPEWSRFTMDDIAVGYEVTCLAFLAFVANLPWSSRTKAVLAQPDVSAQRTRVSLVVLAIAALLLLGLRAALGIGVMGLDSSGLPLGVDTLLFRAQSSLIPALLLVVMWAGERTGRRAESNLAALALAVHLAAVAAVAASKAGLIYLALYVVGLWVACDRLSRARQLLLLLLGFLAVFTFGLGAELRTLRIEGLTLSEAAKAMADTGESFSIVSIRNGLRAIFLRITGVDGIWFVIGDPVWSAATFQERISAVWHGSIVELYTRQIVGVTWLQDFRAPGFVGAFVLLLGVPGLLLNLLLGPALSFLWVLIGRLPGTPALAAFSAAFVLQMLMDGTFRWQDFVVFFVTLPMAAAFAFWLQERNFGREIADSSKVARACAHG